MANAPRKLDALHSVGSFRCRVGRGIREAAALEFAMRAFARHWGALLALALFLTAGLAILDDYGAVWDEHAQRKNANANLDYLADGDLRAFLSALYADHDKFYGMAYEIPLMLSERAFGIEDYDHRAVYLLRHLVVHLLFLVGGLFAYLIVFRLFGDRLLAFAAMPMFLLHPRLYAHSFFNGKDIPFLVMFIIALFLTHRAFRRGSVFAFVLLGAAVGVLLNLRILGVVPLAAVLGARTLDIAFARGRTERMRVLLTGAAFALAAGLTIYALLPYLWADPIARVIEWWTTLSDHPTRISQLFRGTSGRSVEFPEYLPLWFSITSPPFALLLGLIGAASVIAFGTRAGKSALLDARTRFLLLLAGCFFAPILWVVVTGPNMYHGWRQAYFLWAPFSLLAVIGLRGLAEALGRKRLRRLAYGAAGAGLAAGALSMALLHPNQQVSFNVLVDRATPERLRAQYEMDYWNLAMRPTFDWILRSELILNNEGRVSSDAFYSPGWDILPSGARAKLSVSASQDALVAKSAPISSEFDAPPNLVLHRVEAYGNTLATVERKMDMQAVYDATRGVEPGVGSVFDFYPMENGVALVKEPCAPSFIRDQGAHLWNKEVYLYRNLVAYGAAFDGKCAALIHGLGFSPPRFHFAWQPELMNDREAREVVRRAREEGRLLADAAYEAWLVGEDIVYIRDQCDPLETERPFFIDVIPERSSDSPDTRLRAGYESVKFSFHPNGAFVDEACVAAFPLPDYPFVGARISQSEEDGGALWQAAFVLDQEPYRAAYETVASREPLARGVFDVHLADGALIYAKESCDWTDTEARFFLHIFPDRAESQGERGAAEFDNLDFDFFLVGVRFDGKCVASVALPDYPVAGVRTGQFGDSGEVWSVAFSLELGAPSSAYETAVSGEPLARGVFDLYLADGRLVYAKEDCALADAEARFFLHVVPERATDLPQARRAAGFDNLDFDFFLRGALFDGKCVASVPLPDYPIAGVRTGQSAGGEGELWSVEVAMRDEALRP